MAPVSGYNPQAQTEQQIETFAEVSICFIIRVNITNADLHHTPLVVTVRLSLQKELENWLGEDFFYLDILATHNIITNVVTLVDSGIVAALAWKNFSLILALRRNS